MTTSYYRIQSAGREVGDLLDASEQVSRTWSNSTNEGVYDEGVSVVDSVESLATYLATAGQGIPIGDGQWVIVELAGEYLGWGRDKDAGEMLIRPTAILSVTFADDGFYEMVGAAYDADQA